MRVNKDIPNVEAILSTNDVIAANITACSETYDSNQLPISERLEAVIKPLRMHIDSTASCVILPLVYEVAYHVVVEDI